MSKWEMKKENNSTLSSIINNNGYVCHIIPDKYAEQIVREHNAHEELVNSLEAFVKNEGYDRKDIREMLVRNAEAALQKAKGNE